MHSDSELPTYERESDKENMIEPDRRGGGEIWKYAREAIISCPACLSGKSQRPALYIRAAAQSEINSLRCVSAIHYVIYSPGALITDELDFALRMRERESAGVCCISAREG